MKKFFLSRIIISAVLFLVLAPISNTPAYGGDSGANTSTPGGALQNFVNKTPYQGQQPNVDNPLATAIGAVIQTVLSLLAIIFLILTIYAGATWMMAGGEKEKIEKSRKILIQAVIGFAIVIFAYLITYTVIKILTAGTVGDDSISLW